MTSMPRTVAEFSRRLMAGAPGQAGAAHDANVLK